MQETWVQSLGWEDPLAKGKATHSSILAWRIPYFRCFFGVLLAGGVPVPIYPPTRPSQIEDHLRRHAGILSNALAAMLVTVPEAKPVARLLQAQVESLRAVLTVEELTHSGKAPGYALQPGQIALLQYTSGSTANPKGG